MKLANKTNMVLEQNLSFQQLQSLQLLEYCNIELEFFLANEYDENPLLEMVEDYTEEKKYENEDNLINFENFIKEDEDQFKNFVKMQIPYQQYNDQELEVIEYLIDHVDNDGLFDIPLDLVCKETNSSIEMVKHLLFELQKLEPAGIFCKNVQDCLIVQLKRKNMLDSISKKIINEYFDDLIHQQFQFLQNKLGLSSYHFKKYIDLFQHLYEKPISAVENSKINWIIPDFIASYINGEWMVELNDRWMTNYRINDYYVSMVKKAGTSDMKNYYEAKRIRLKSLFDAIEQRRNTLLKTITSILTYQSEYLLNGTSIKPMTLSTIAEFVGVHESTISRAIQNKYLQVNGHVFKIKSLFSKESKSNGISVNHIEHCIIELIKNENKEKPYSDSQLSSLLLEQGFSISRRTVAQYRKQLGIDESYKRKK